MRRKRQGTTLALVCLTFVAALVCSLPAQAAAQNVTITQRSGSLDNVLRQLATQADVQIVYNTESARRVHLDNFEVRGQSVESTLTKALEGTNMSYTVNNGIYMVREQQAPPARSVSGRVVDEKGNAVVGAGIQVVGSRQGTTSDANGNFALRVGGTGDVNLEISHVGRKTTRVTWKGSVLTVRLVEQAVQTQSVIVTGVFDKPKESYTGAATMLTAEQLDQAGTGNLVARINLLEPAFHIQENNLTGSDPNAVNMNITMRGSTSVNVGLVQDNMRDQMSSNLPLFILDQFEVDLQTVLNLDPTQVESVTILKDAAATALYGSRGANGIVVITKKPPLPGQVTVTYRGYLNVQAPDLSSYNLLNAREKLEYEKIVGLYNSESVTQQASMDEIYSRHRVNVERGVDTYWLKFPVRVGLGHNHSVTVEGGDNNILYSGSMNYSNTVGVMKGSKKDIVSGNIALTYMSKTLRITDELGVGHTQGNNSPYGSFDTWVRLNPYWAPYDDEGHIVRYLNDGYQVDGRTRVQGNPLYDALLPFLSRNKSDSYYNNLLVNWQPIQGLNVRGLFRIDRQTGTTDDYRDPRHSAFVNYSMADYVRRGTYTFGYNETSNNYQGQFLVSYNKVFAEKHQIYSGFMANISQNRGLSSTMGAEGFATSDFVSLGMASAYTKDGRPTSGDSFVRSAGMSASVNYTYDGKYYVDLSGRMDGSSQFGANRQTAPFYSAGIGWNLHNEDFMKNSSWIHRLLLRADYGTSGSQNFSAFQARTTFQSQYGNLYNNLWQGMQMMALGNPDLEWQITRSFNVGMEASLLRERISIRADVYERITDGILMDINLPISSGFSSFKANLGKVSNRGLESNIYGWIIRQPNRGFQWMVSAGLVTNKNKVLSISNGVKKLNEELGSNVNMIKQSTNMVKEGQALNTLYVVKSLGIDPATGQEIYENLDGTKTFNWDPSQRQAFGTEDSKVWGNISTLLRYKSFALNIAFSYQWGGYKYNQTLVDRVENVNPRYNVDHRVYDYRWRNPGDHARYRDIRTYDIDTQASSRFVMKDNVLQCRLIDLSYEPNPEWLRRTLHMKYLKVGASTENPFRFGTIKQERGINYPFAHTYSLSLTARF